MGIHPNFYQLREARAGRPMDRLPVGAGETWNHKAGWLAVVLEVLRQSAENGRQPHLLDSLDRGIHAATEHWSVDRERGLFRGEGVHSYGGLHALAGLGAHDAVIGLRHAADSGALRRLHSLLLGFNRAWASLFLEWRGAKGVCRSVGTRCKIGSVEHGNVVIPDIVLNDLEPATHPALRERLYGPKADRSAAWWSKHRQHEAMMADLLEVSDAWQEVKEAPLGGSRLVGRLVHDVGWDRREDGGLHIVAPSLPAILDSDGRGGVTDAHWRWTGETYERVEVRQRVSKGANLRWEQRIDSRDVLAEELWYTRIQSCPPGRPMPHPLGRTIPSHFATVGPRSDPFPLPEVHAVVGPPARPGEITWRTLNRMHHAETPMSDKVILVLIGQALRYRDRHPRLQRASERWQSRTGWVGQELSWIVIERAPLATRTLVVAALVVSLEAEAPETLRDAAAQFWQAFNRSPNGVDP